jgi:ABC-type multidrug transport system ATPase subunit
MPDAAAPADEASAVLRMHDVEVRYQDAVAVQGISLKVQRGQVVVILGPNGAGKTTTLRAIT